MKNQLPVIAIVRGLGSIVEVVSDYYTELRQLHDSGTRLISPRDEAYARLRTRTKERIGTVYGTRTTAGFEYARDRLPLLRVHSRLTDLRLAKRAVKANAARHYFRTRSTKEYDDSFLQAELDRSKEPQDRTVVVLPSRDPFTISDQQHWDIYQALLKDQARPYFQYNGPITVYLIEKGTVDAQNGTILTVMWFRGFDGASIFYGFSRNLNHDDRARGVFPDNGGVSRARSIVAPELCARIDRYLQLLDNIKAGRAGLSRLAEVEGFLRRLQQ